MLLPSFSNVIVYLNFKANQDEIAKTLCIQKEMKNNKCNGNCYLSKQLKKEAEKEKQESSNLREKQELVYTQTLLTYNFSSNTIIEKTRIRISMYREKPKSIAFSIFHPPLV
ncbi:hypothetical protein DB891_02825 [Flavobacterium laiguense]|uniref:Uncharacterized protein n=2 Tax=Flavobacterium laiguense TaxID=2169409 RepID=A0A2U1K0S9_9FLAO|nr:hypothetical protein DB891_02825 [Flavobacterium laiguense]